MSNEAVARDTSLGEFGPGLRPVEWVLSAYLLGTALLLIPMGSRVADWQLYFVSHLAALALLVGLGRWGGRCSPVVGVLRRLFPFLLAPFVYSEMAALNDMFFGQRLFDSSVVAWEAALFGGQPSQSLRDLWPRGLLSEYLHLAYFSYYGLAMVLWLSLSLQRRWKALEEYLTVVTLTFSSCMAWYLFFPVAGPFHYFGPAQPESMGQLFPPLVHRVLHAGSSVGTAFPSSHVAVAGAVLCMAFLKHRPTAWALMLLVPALAVGAVYGGFHYAIDAVAGALWCVLCVLVGRPLHRRLRGGEPAHATKTGG